jgi:general secretion pathway protein D
LATTASAQLRLPDPTAIEATLAAKLAQRGDLTLDDAAMAETLMRVSEIWGVNLVVAAQIEGRVTGSFRNAPLHEILDAVLIANGYGYRPVGQSLVVMKLADLGEMNPMFTTAALRARYAPPSVLAESLRLLCSPKGKVQPLDAAGVLLVCDFPDRVDAIRRLVEQMDAVGPTAANGGQAPPFEVTHFAPQFVPAMAMKDAVQAVLSQNGKIAVLPLENQLVVADFAPHLALAGRVVQELDFPRQQVRITALIYDLSVQDMVELGVNWGHALKFRPDTAGDPQTVFSGATVLQTLPAPDATSGVMTLMNLSQHVDLTAVVQALSQAQNSRLLANPNVTVIENEPADISIVTEIPYQQLTETQQGGNIGTTAFREAGVKLEVVPTIAADGTIQMVVTPSFSRLTGYTPGEQPQPIIDRREARTTVRVANGQTLVIGGLRQRQEINDYNGIPFLKDLWGVGALFRHRSNTVRESELVVFVRPEIVSPCYPGLPREEMARDATYGMLSNIPPAVPPDACIPRLPEVSAEMSVAPAPGVSIPMDYPQTPPLPSEAPRTLAPPWREEIPSPPPPPLPQPSAPGVQEALPPVAPPAGPELTRPVTPSAASRPTSPTSGNPSSARMRPSSRRSLLNP